MDFYGFISAIETITKRLNPLQFSYSPYQCMFTLIKKLKKELTKRTLLKSLEKVKIMN